ncbi:18272_t:CDS:10 [Gigaspora margarita]|uniref:18272_t:CDS:1 n=1 Tax=Gigaspora margarita TaxID=4874 RepID=A0ABN7VGK2_GIGMA|nr:18272_t:CDS:10 [Gigaspora margarita]
MPFKYQSINDYDNNNVNRKQPKDPENTYLIIAKHGAVASELVNCSRIGVDVLKEGGSAVDAVIATELCVGTINAFSAGIGGGGLMLIRLPNGTTEIIDFRETAPLNATKKMFVGNPNSAFIGGLSVGVPGEINGMKIAHERYGKLPWKRLFEPSIKLSRDGFPVGKELDIRLKLFSNEMEQDPVLSAIYAPSGKILKKGEIGSIARSLIKEINRRGGIMSCDDFKNYKSIIREPVIGYYHGRKIITTSEPTSGPSLIFMLNLLEKYEMSNNGLDITNLHSSLPAFFLKFRDQFAHETRIQEILSKEYAALVRANVSDNQTFRPDYYNPIYDHKDDHDPVTGILLNDEMSDFSIPGAPNSFELWPSPYNFVSPGKRPLSSTIPTIVENENGNVELVTGGSGGTKILSAVLQLGIEQGLDYELVDKLLTIGHVVQLHNMENRIHSCQVNAVRKFKDGTIHAVSDFRKNGIAAGY